MAVTAPVFDRLSELKSFDDTRLGVKGLVDSGLNKVPRIFHQVDLTGKPNPGNTQFSIPIINLEGIKGDPLRRQEVVKEILEAAEKWGFFQVVNHGLSVSVLDEMIEGVRRFHEQDGELKKALYGREFAAEKRVLYNSNFYLYQAYAADWRDTFACDMAPIPPKPEELPAVCRDIMIEYTNQVTELGLTLFELLSEALGLDSNHLKDMACAEGLALAGLYYPPCPEPELTMASKSHTDPGFLTVLLQDNIGGLQVLHNGNWVDVHYVAGALIMNIADLLQLITNDKFKSVKHRVLAKKVGPRISVVCFFRTIFREGNMHPRVYGPIKELLSAENPPLYKETTTLEYVKDLTNRGIDAESGLLYLKI